MNGARSKARRLLADPAVQAVVVEHKDRLGRMNVELVEAALSAAGRRLVVLDDCEVEDDMVEVLTSFCAHRSRCRADPTVAQCPVAGRGADPSLAPGSSGPVTVAFKNATSTDAVNDGRLYMELGAPYYTRFTDVTLTPVDGAPGGWTCTGDAAVEGQPYEGTILRCQSYEKGLVAAAGRIARWKVNMNVYGDAPANRLLPNAGEGGYGAVLNYTRGEPIRMGHHGPADSHQRFLKGKFGTPRCRTRPVLILLEQDGVARA